MTKMKLLYIVFSVVGALVLVGVGFGAYFIAGSRNEGLIHVSIHEGETQSVTFESLSLLPGEARAYTLSFSPEVPKRYGLTFTFREVGDEQLKHYAYARIEANGVVVCEEKLSRLFRDEEIFLEVDFSENKNTNVKIVYFIPEWVENEAQGAEADFLLLISASNREVADE